ncbi:cilia- and flagella-associated protein 43 isoform X2 [Cotesia typhae]|uniref:cilia- and flagella-associated protein 43 isoform X2 n=1 Tax=Cotesia typhae TaxID=2053667 RepID=UPI003D68E735
MPANDTKWVKFGDINNIVFLGKDIIALSSGYHILFVNLNTKYEKIEKFDNKDRGDGISSFSGHPIVPIFAIAERCSNPKISIFTYPEIEKISTCVHKKHGQRSFCLSCIFVGSDYLVTLNSYPSFQLIIWLWRTGENLRIIDTDISDINQQISCSMTLPMFLTQRGDSGRIKVYEVSVCSKIILLTSSAININFNAFEKIVASSWTFDGNLLIADDLGNVFLILSDGKRRYKVVESLLEVPMLSKPLIVDFRCGVAVVNSRSKIKFYRKSSEHSKHFTLWKPVWELETQSQPLFMTRNPHRDSLLFHTEAGEIVEVSVGDDDVPRMQMVCHQGSTYAFLMPINPNGRHCAVLDDFNRLVIIESDSGNLTSSISLESYGKVLNAIAHPFVPLIITTTDNGFCNITSIIDVLAPITIKPLFLTKEPLDKIKLSFDAQVLAVAHKSNGQLFFINNFDTFKINVWTSLKIQYEIADFLIHENDDNRLKLLILTKGHAEINIGKSVIIYVMEMKSMFETLGIVERIIELPFAFKNLNYGSNINEIIASPYLSKHVVNMKLEDNLKSIRLTECVNSSHQLRDVNINSDSSITLTYGADGILVMRNRANIYQLTGMFSSHHRHDGGVKFAIVCTASNIVICLGTNGNIIATKIGQLSTISQLELNERDINFVDTFKILSEKTSSDLDIESELPWFEWIQIQKLNTEKDSSIVKRTELLSDVNSLKIKLKNILDKNEKETEDKKLATETFDLNTQARFEQITRNELDQEELEKTIGEKISGQIKMMEYLRKMCWDSMLVPACSLISLDGKIRVDNYALPAVSSDELQQRSWDKFSIDLVTRMTSIDVELNQPTAVKNEERIANNKEELFSMSGTTFHRWINSFPGVNQIYRNGSYTEGTRLRISIKIREEKLKLFFNDLFTRMQQLKSQEIKITKDRIARMKHCSSELKTMFNVEFSTDYTWLHLELSDSEKPHTIVKVDDKEIYKLITYSTNIPHENENNLRLAEDQVSLFREKALMEMMGGVLEVRWEDEIKKDIVKPKCLSKNSINYSEEDLLIIKKYEEDVKILNNERLKYKKILQDEIVSLQDLLKKGVKSFDEKLENLFLERIKIESAVLQENLMKQRELRRHQLRLQGIKELNDLENEFLAASKELKSQTEEFLQLELVLNETKLRYENLSKREKLLESKFRGEFPDLKQPMVEHLLRHYKKRPRNGQFLCTSIMYLSELSRCILTGDKSDILPRNCLDFLKGVNSLDIMPTSLPSQIDSNHWFLLCKLRRNKVEIEIRLKSCAVELAEAEQTLNAYQKATTGSQNRVAQLRDMMESGKKKNEDVMRDMEVQLVLQMGQIETNLCGHPREFKNSVLVSFDEVLKVNTAIVEAGRNKLEAMNQTIVFRKTINWKEWCHSCLKITLQDMKEELRVLQDVKVTKEIQKYLMRHLHTPGSEKDVDIWERSVMSTKKHFTRILEGKKTKLIDIKSQLDNWQKLNTSVNTKIQEIKLATCKLTIRCNEDARVKDFKHQRVKLKAIMKKNRLITRVQNNYDDLLTLRSQLEILRLKTYPTLRLRKK